MLLISTALMFASIFMLARYGYAPFGRWFGARVSRDEKKFAAWADEMYLDWGERRLRRLAVLANVGGVALGVLIYALTGRIIFALAVGFAASRIPPFLYRSKREKRLERFDEQLPEG